jgi:hypothetical protein
MRIYIVLLILLGLILILQYCEKYNLEKFAELKKLKYSTDCGDVPELLGKVMGERNMEKTRDDYDYYIPCSYNSCEKDVLAFENKEKGKKIFLIDGCDWIASKLALWELLKDQYGKDASKYMPTTHLLEDKKDLENFPKHFEENKKLRPDQMYVLKNYAQRQEGIKLTRNLNEIIGGLKEGWYLAQDYVYNPFIIANRKINFRYYLLVVCRNGKIEGYIHKDGFIYYTPKHYEEHDMDFDKHITTGYIDRKVYELNPLTLQDFRDYLDCEKRVESEADTKWKCLSNNKTGLSKVWDASAENLMNKVMEAISKKICKNNKLNNHVRFQLFGCDLAPDANLGCTLMEINKGPDLNAKDERDKQVKIQVQRDIFKIIDPDEEFENIEDNNERLKEIVKNTRFVKIF